MMIHKVAILSCSPAYTCCDAIRHEPFDLCIKPANAVSQSFDAVETLLISCCLAGHARLTVYRVMLGLTRFGDGSNSKDVSCFEMVFVLRARNKGRMQWLIDARDIASLYSSVNTSIHKVRSAANRKIVLQIAQRLETNLPQSRELRS